MSMKLDVGCIKCNDFFIEQQFHPEINNLNLYEFTCNKGHKTAIIRDEETYELLFEYAIHAILDGYYREAVNSIASSLERFYEYSIKVIFIKRNLFNSIESVWKNVANQSERQLGAFIFTYTYEFNQIPVVLNDKNTHFRNKVIHKGYFPTYLETIEFAEAVFKIINSSLVNLKRECSNEMTMFQNDRLIKANAEAKKITEDIMTLNDSIIFNTILVNSVSALSVADYLEIVKRR